MDLLSKLPNMNIMELKQLARDVKAKKRVILPSEEYGTYLGCKLFYLNFHGKMNQKPKQEYTEKKYVLDRIEEHISIKEEEQTESKGRYTEEPRFEEMLFPFKRAIRCLVKDEYFF